jgi:peptidoglycan/LPS O-acetylase OafA/YrhL
MSAYRPDIDGLRAIAVTSVVLFHAGMTSISGGFTGVDIFFVISGFLITGLLVEEYDTTGRVSIAGFYARRVRRLLPALLFVILATLALGLALFPPTGELQGLTKSALAALFFVSNFFFFFQPSGYFAEAAESYPLLHTWTLAVEEQFYIVWPLLVPMLGWLAARAKVDRKRFQIISFAAIGIASFALCQWALGWRPMLSFYMMPLRAWEFAIGAMLALVLPRWIEIGREAAHGNQGWLATRIPPHGPLLSFAGLAACLLGFWLIRSETGFPGVLALLPVLGAAMLLTGNAMPGPNPVARLLETAPFTYVGKLSYGWYLWHWPLFAFARWHTEGTPGPALMAGALIASLVASAISYHLIETPIRTKQVAPFKTLAGTLAGGAAILGLGGAAAWGSGMIAENRMAASPLYTAIVATKNAKLSWPGACSNYEAPFRALTAAKDCKFGQKTAAQGIMLVGDSHAAHLIPTLEIWSAKNSRFLLPRTRGGCRPFGGPFLTNRIAPTSVNFSDCSNFNQAVRAEIDGARAAGVSTIIFASMWPYPGDDKTQPLKPIPAAWLLDLRAITKYAKDKGLNVVLAVDTPKSPGPVPLCLTRKPVSACGPNYAAAQARRDAFLNLASKWAVIDPTPALCPDDTCPAVADGVVLYKDGDHLSIPGAKWLAGKMKAQLDGVLRQ